MPVATETFDYFSEALIDEKGKLTRRIFEMAKDWRDLAIHEDILKKHDLNKDRSFIEAEIRRALNMRAKKHDGMTTSCCAPTIGKTGDEKL